MITEMVYNQGKQAAKLGMTKFVRRQAFKYLALQDKSKRGQRMLLGMKRLVCKGECENFPVILSPLPGISASPSRGPNVSKSPVTVTV